MLRARHATSNRVRMNGLNVHRSAWLLALTAAGVATPLPAQQSHPLAPAVVPKSEAYLSASPQTGPRTLHRWETLPGGQPRTLRLFVGPLPPGFDSRFVSVAVDALSEWASEGEIPLRFQLVEDVTLADIELLWVERFEDERAGVAAWSADENGWLRFATVDFALHHPDGARISLDFFRTVALHEGGHVLGLPHSDDPRDVMHPGSTNSTLSDRDRSSLQRLYSLSPWSLLPGEHR